MRYSVQIETDELKALLAAAEQLIRLVVEARATATSSPRAPMSVPPEPPLEAPPGATVTPLRVVSSAEPVEAHAEKAADATTAKALHGRDLWLALIEVWRGGFGVEGAPQPDRVETLVRLLHMDGASIFAYLRTKRGLTDATRDVLCEIHQRPLDNVIKREARLIAENIAQVASFHAPDLTERLEYAAEFHHIED